MLVCGKSWTFVFNVSVEGDNWWLVELPMWLTDGFLDTFFGRWRGAVCIHVSHVQLTCGINVQGNDYYMVEGSPHVWLTCGN